MYDYFVVYSICSPYSLFFNTLQQGVRIHEP